MKWIARLFLLMILFLGAGACRGSDDDMVGVGITGIDHLADHLSVQQFYVDGYNAFQAGDGGSHVCCAMLPNKWRPNLSVKLQWSVVNWRDCTTTEFVRRVPVEKYDEAGKIWVHFLSDGSVRIVSSGIYGPLNPNYLGPSDPIPNKAPWDVYPLKKTCA